MPQGKLRVSKNRGVPRYYHITDPKDTVGNYITKDNQEMASKLAEKDYLNKLKKEVEAELQDINIYLRKHMSSDLENIYRNMNDYRKNLITPLVMPDELYAQQWKNQSYTINPYYENERKYPTKNNELVRSKSEALLADMYYDMGIPYRYDAELKLKNGKRKYPDFTLLDIKLDEYRRNGIYPGKNMIITYEAEGCYLNIKEIREMIKEIFELE